MSIDLLMNASRLAKSYGARKLLDVRLTNITPALVGSWTATRYTNDTNRGERIVEPPRPTDIAGKTRWWLRAILAAGVYEEFGLHAPTYLLDEIASMIMGSTGSEGASKIQIVVKPRYWCNRYRCETYTINDACFIHSLRWDPRPSLTKARKRILRIVNDRGLQSIQHQCNSRSPGKCCSAALLSSRVLLTLLGSARISAENIPLPPGFFDFGLQVLWRPGAQSTDAILEQRLIGLAIGLALFFTGIGRMTTRGYGKLAMLSARGSTTALSREVADTFQTLLDVDHAIHTLAERATRYAKSYIESLSASQRRNIELKLRSSPHVLLDTAVQETLHRDYIIAKSLDTRCILMRVIEEERENHIDCNNDPWCIVAAISEAVKKTSIKHMILRKYFHGTGLGIPSYILGLPRKGTTIRKGSTTFQRLISQIHFSPIGMVDKNGEISLKKLIILGFETILSNLFALREHGYTIKYNPGHKAISKLCEITLFKYDYGECLRLLRLMYSPYSLGPLSNLLNDAVMQAALEAYTFLKDGCKINLSELIDTITDYMTMTCIHNIHR